MQSKVKPYTYTYGSVFGIKTELPWLLCICYIIVAVVTVALHCRIFIPV